MAQRKDSRTALIQLPVSVSEAALRPWESEFSRDHGGSLTAWAIAYYADVAKAGKRATLSEKKRDLELFLGFFAEIVGTDNVADWTRSTSLRFIEWVEHQPTKKTGKPRSYVTINRTLATLRHFARFIQNYRKLPGGPPFEGVRDLRVDEPSWKGLSDKELSRVLAALDRLCRSKTHGNQMPKRDYAAVRLNYQTALRASEILRLDFHQYDGKHLHSVKRKGRTESKKVFLSRDVRAALYGYIKQERGTEPGPLFITKSRGRMSRQQLDRVLKQIQAEVNAKYPDSPIKLHSHLLRHTSLKRTCEKRGLPAAKRKAGHAENSKHIWRYVSPSDEEMQQAEEEDFA